MEEKKLHVEMSHITKNPRKHLIRKISLYKNGQLVDSFIYVQQQTSGSIDLDFPIEAVSKDVLRVEAFCSKAGRSDKSLTVP